MAILSNDWSRAVIDSPTPAYKCPHFPAGEFLGRFVSETQLTRITIEVELLKI